MPVRGKRVTAVVMERNGTVQDRRDTVVESGRFVSVTGKGVVSSRIKNYAADPFFVRKAAEAKAEIDKVGLPKIKNKK